ncbi:23S rRNA pseudouridine1911/1915/1917 synthase [Desulfobaculum xiamenense]|uniref:Dephospho-CoA kinase n=1 Tax=Desulfobaculum xiamenense TaxID=995050 RepID=A0A846QRQ6_9BACT|nr:dephospho-CoA kinase [Desulfobaculum xiamenense]NJB67349.1 23S rRNA pseudouridine1911/1915/1917 synthase [Desulfobaculum xiamenense]
MTHEAIFDESATSGGVWNAVVPEGMAGERLDVFLAGELRESGLSRSKLQGLIKAGKATVDGCVTTKPRLVLEGGESVSLLVDLPGGDLTPEEGDLDVVYEDESLVVLNKPAGLTVHPAPTQTENTLVHRLVHHYPGMLDMEGERPGIVHRIDKDTSGLILVALDEGTRLDLSEDFAERRVEKHYLAVVHGVPCSTSRASHGEIEAPIGRDPRHKTRMAVTEKGGREARTAWEVLWSSPDRRASLVRVRIFTGRTHQIRVHMAHIGHPLMGDEVYGARQHKQWLRETGCDPALAPRQMLHAWRLGFEHPETGERLDFMQAPPEDFRRLMFHLARTTLRVGIVGMPGCGKSALSAMLERRGVPLFSADAVVRELYAEGEDGWVLIRRRFGAEFAPDGGPVNKARVLASMRESAEFRKELEGIVHPLVDHRLNAFWDAHTGATVAVAEVPLLVEGGADVQNEQADIAVGVRCPEDVRRGRLMARGWDDATIALIESWQWSEADKLSRCAEVVDNSGTLDDLDREADALLARLEGEHARREAEVRARIAALWGAG